MNKVAANSLAAIVLMIVVFFVGRLFFLSSLQTELQQASQLLEENQRKYAALEIEVSKIKPESPEEMAGRKKASGESRLIRPGEEASLLRQISEKGGDSFRMHSFDIIEAFRFKPETDITDAGAGAQNFAAGTQELPQLDEQGMPVGLAAEDDIEWPGVEVVPAKMTFATSIRALGKFLSEAGRSMPINSIRSLDLIMRDGGLVRGTLVLNFPLAEGR
ncbi:MAG TPA: hypothetical protein PLK28_11885 [Candidatus Rifleibacterium sp.]|jgi:hypothetical protein|nr:hypothetical protein [Candidatus Rifleibacterium sp.]HOI91199.1 hypothetical protein [Candidatus Rifleibacterium sp.]HPW59510.1 hypothetical protein [Candidatus Rifleibacterium sp.]